MTSSTQQPSNRRGILLVSFAVYLALLAWVVLWKLDVPWIGEAAGLARPIKLVPFVAAGDDGASKPTEMLINLVLFAPFGLFAGALAPTWSWWKTGAAALATSLMLETVQHVISTGSFDITDLIVNTAGALIGWRVFVGIRRVSGERTSVVMFRVCVVVAALSLVAVIAFVASPIEYGPQHDVVVDHMEATR